jgi:hypothetical protein
MGTGKDFKLYREAVTTKDASPYIPFLGTFIKDISFLEETSPWKQRDLIHLEKIFSIGRILREFSQIQKVSKKIQFNPQVNYSNALPLIPSPKFVLTYLPLKCGTNKTL